MTASEYLGQARWLDQKIRFCREEISRLEELMTSISSPSFEEHYSSSRSTAAPYEHILEKLEERRNEESRLLETALKFDEEAKLLINKLDSDDEIIVLTRVYFRNESLRKIARELGVCEKTARKLYHSALLHFTLPDNPTNTKLNEKIF